MCSPLPGQVFLQENVPAGLASTHRRSRLAGLQHAHRTRRVRQNAQVISDGARVSRVGVVQRQLATVRAGPQVSCVCRRTESQSVKRRREMNEIQALDPVVCNFIAKFLKPGLL